jgi:DNA-binding Lrp family transcriptional regulator
MKNKNVESNEEGQTVISVIQAIKSGLDPKSLPVESRQACVELLHFSEGHTISQIAELLHCSEKTVRRDIKELRKRNVITIDLEFSKQLFSELYYRGINHANFLIRLARSKESSVAEKISAELGACKVFLDLIDKFQSFGFLPSKTQQVKGEVYHHFASDNEEINLEEVKQMVLQIEQTTKESGMFDEKTEKHIDELKAKIAKIEISQDVKKFTKDLDNTTKQKEEPHE